MNKEKINKQIEDLNIILEKLNVLDQESEIVKDNKKIIQEQITSLQVELTDINKYNPIYKRVFKNLFTSKIIAINIIWIICEILNSFTDLFSHSNNEIIITLRTVVPSLTIFLRSIKQ